jgi:AbrB family looped-hinge helix DNA binding protein
MQSTETLIGKGGRIVIPAGYRKELGVKAGDHVVLILEDG